jgi:hypothetical protein
VERGARREGLLHHRLHPAIELRRLELAPHDRHAPDAGELEHLGRHLLTLGHEDARQLELEELLQRLAPLLGGRAFR